jgi:hypothetical protein
MANNEDDGDKDEQQQQDDRMVMATGRQQGVKPNEKEAQETSTSLGPQVGLFSLCFLHFIFILLTVFRYQF